VAPFDREATLKAAEKALKLGKVDVAIAEYVKVVEAQPRDWNTANALGDLYVRAKQTEKGVKQYTRIADHLAEEGFYPKAAALFKKILKVKPEDEYAILQSGDLSAKQNKIAEAKTYFQQVMDRRRKKGDKKGATDIAIRMGTRVQGRRGPASETGQACRSADAVAGGLRPGSFRRGSPRPVVCRLPHLEPRGSAPVCEGS
jgi:tetratricopeptide (TPR) repeat protein